MSFGLNKLNSIMV